MQTRRELLCPNDAPNKIVYHKKDEYDLYTVYRKGCHILSMIQFDSKDVSGIQNRDLLRIALDQVEQRSDMTTNKKEHVMCCLLEAISILDQEEK